MSLGSKIRTGAMVSGAISVHRISKAQRQSASAQQQQAWAQQQQAAAQHAQAQALTRAAHAAEYQAQVAAQAAADQRRLAENAAEQALRAQFAHWRQTPDGRAYEGWKEHALALSDDLLARIQPAAEFQSKIAAAHAYDVQEALRHYPGPAVAIPQPVQRVVPSPNIGPVAVIGAVVGLFVLLPLLTGALDALVGLVAPGLDNSRNVGQVMALAITAVICFLGVRAIQRSRVEKAEKERMVALSEYEAGVGRWREWQFHASQAASGRAAYLSGASEDPRRVPEWWEVSVSEGGFLPLREEIAGYEARAMREFPSPNRLPKLERPALKILGNIPGGPEVQKAVAWYRTHHPMDS